MLIRDLPEIFLKKQRRRREAPRRGSRAHSLVLLSARAQDRQEQAEQKECNETAHGGMAGVLMWSKRMRRKSAREL
jgi:hypothetical protein